MTLDRRIAARLDALRRRDLLRSLPAVSHREGVHYHLHGRPVVGFCSNDYLGLAVEASPPAPTTPSGAGASRLISGDLPDHRDVERRLAAFAGMDDAVVFPSGYQLNVGVLSALVQPDDVVYSDRLNHASLIDGLRLARADVTILPHLAAPDPAPANWWITESIYSMDGDALDLDAAARHRDAGGVLYVDEAHALGLFEGGRGWLPASLRPDVFVGTLSKAFGAAGAFVAASTTVCEYIRNRARSFVFSTGTSPRVMASIACALERVTGSDGDRRRAALWSNVTRLHRALGRDGAPPPSPIVPLLVGDNALAVSLAGALLERGWHVQPIRPPTVPDGTARLRLTVCALHTAEQIDALAADLHALFDAAALSVAPRTTEPSLRAAP